MSSTNQNDVLCVEMQSLLTGSADKQRKEFEPSDDDNDMMITFINNETRDKIRKLKHEGETLQAISELENLISREINSVDKFNSMVQLGEFYCKMDKVLEAKQSIERLNRQVETMKIPESYVNTLRKRAFAEGKYVRAFLYTVCMKCDVMSDETVTVPLWVANIIEIVDKIRGDYNLLCSQLILPMIKDMANYHDVLKNSPAKLVVNKAWLMYGVAVCRGYIGEDDEMVNTAKNTIKLLEKHIGKESSPLYRVYGLCLICIKEYKQASTALVAASDWPSQSVKDKCMKTLGNLH